MADINKIQVPGITDPLVIKDDSGTQSDHKHTKSQITDFPTSMPASDVSAWAKAANKPSYNFSEINNRGEAYLTWGGKNFSDSYGPIDAAMVPCLGANRMAFINGDCVTVEYSRDGGSTWVDYGLTKAQKTSLFSGPKIAQGIKIGKPADVTGKDADGRYSPVTNDNQVRVTINTRSASLYTVLNKFVFYVTTSGSSGSKVTIRARTETNRINNVDTWTVFADGISVGGWSGYNVINTSGLTTYGNTPASQFGQVQFIFYATTNTNTRYGGLSVSNIYGFGGVGWTTPSTMASWGQLYTYDSSQNVTFSAGVSATSFTENGTTLANKYLGKTDKAADSAKLNGQAASYYLNYNNLSNTPTISTNITTDATSDTKTASPKAVKTYVDDSIAAAITTALNTAV